MGTTHEYRNNESVRPVNDFYQTPLCATKELIENYLKDFPRDIRILDPCCGKYAIEKELYKYNFNSIDATDIIYGNDFLINQDAKFYDCVVMNPPFKDFDDFINKAKTKAGIVCSIGKLNFFGSHSRNVNHFWDNLKYILVFDRQIAYDRPFREDGKVECGMLISGWFIWDKSYQGSPHIKVIDMQKYILKKGEIENENSNK